jgi:nucleosome binding factor SPN SPT16 subunit
MEEALDKLESYKISIDTEEFDFLIKPIVQSGGEYNVHYTKPGTKSTAKQFSHDVMIVAVGMRYRNVLGLVARTYFVDSTDSQTTVYGAILKAQKVRNMFKSTTFDLTLHQMRQRCVL